jgi:hypothetical protein
MANVHMRKHFIHTADVRRATITQSTSGEPILTWATASSIVGRLVQRNERIANESQSLQMQLVHRFLCNQDVDVTEEDRIANVVETSSGASINPGPFEIHEQLLRNSTAQHHLSLRLELIN